MSDNDKILPVPYPQFLLGKISEAEALRQDGSPKFPRKIESIVMVLNDELRAELKKKCDMDINSALSAIRDGINADELEDEEWESLKESRIQEKQDNIRWAVAEEIFGNLIPAIDENEMLPRGRKFEDVGVR